MHRLHVPNCYPFYSIRLFNLFSPQMYFHCYQITIVECHVIMSILLSSSNGKHEDLFFIHRENTSKYAAALL